MGYNPFTGSTQTKTALLTNILGMFSELYTSIASIAAGSGVIAAAGDEVVSNLDDKIAVTANEITKAISGTTDKTMTLGLAESVSSRTFVDPVVQGCIKDTIYAITDGAAFEIDPSNGSIQTITLGDNRTPKATNFANGEAITLLVDDGTASAITWTDTTFGASGVTWWTDGGTAPTLETTGYTAIVLLKTGDQVYGARVGYAS